MEWQRTHADFESTDWNLVSALRHDEEKARRAAEEEVGRRYWPPVYGWFRQQGLCRDEAAERTQAFFTEVVVGRQLVARAERRRDDASSLRPLIKVALKNFNIDQVRKGGATPVQFDSEALELEDGLLEERRASGASSIEQAFDERWAMVTLEETLRRCEQHYAGTEAERSWKAFELFVLRPAVTGNPPPPQNTLAEMLGFPDRASVAAAIQTVRVRCRALLRQVVAETGEGRGIVAEELERMGAALRTCV